MYITDVALLHFDFQFKIQVQASTELDMVEGIQVQQI